MENRLILTQNAYFYKTNRKLTKTFIEGLVTEASQHKKGHFVYKNIRDTLIHNTDIFTTTLCVFNYESSPSFLNPGAEIELKYGYLLLVEFDDYLILNKRGTLDISKTLSSSVTELDYEILSKFRVEKETKFKQMALTNIDTNQRAIRRQSMQALDLKESLSTLNTSNKVINSLKLKNRDNETSISLSTSRINELKQKSNLLGFCIWVSSILNLYGKYKSKANYIDNFAQPLNFKKTISTITPISVLFLLYELSNGLSNELIEKIYYQPDINNAGSKRNIPLSSFLELNDTCLDLAPTADKTIYKIVNTFDKDLQLKVLTNDITIQSEKLSKIFIEFSDGEITSLLSYIVKENHFIVAFNNADIRYHLKKLFKDSKLLGNIKFFLNYFESKKDIASITSEKGTITKTTKSFSTTSLFDYTEKKLASDCDYLMCDDLGDEWADYIGFKTKEIIRYYHAKSSKKSFSASALHDLVSQALKNIGNFDLNTNLTQKSAKVSALYSTSLIPRLRKGDTALNFVKKIKATFNQPNIRKEIFLVINFLSKKQLTTELNNLKNGAKCKNQTVQILWILSSLIGTCQEKGISLRIVTKE